MVTLKIEVFLNILYLIKMGIPTYFRYLFQKNNKLVTFESDQPDCLFFDLNSILYKVFYDDQEKNKNSEDIFISNILKEIAFLCNEKVKPKSLIYFALDGPAPRSKMVQQRSRRYKSIQLQEIFKTGTDWNPSNHICPGTTFMYKFCQELLHMIYQKKLHCPEIILNDFAVPGEGEHKILPIIRKYRLEKPESSIIIMSPDNDLLSLSLLTDKRKIYIMRYMDKPTASLLQKEYNKNDIIYISIDKINQDFLPPDINSENIINKKNIVLDYNFLLSIVGNDFVTAVPYMKIKQGGMDKLLNIYHEILKKLDKYLIDPETLHIDFVFLKLIMQELAKKENNEFLILGSFIQRERSGSTGNFYSEENLTPEQKYKNDVQHLYLCNNQHPLYDIYEEDFQKVNFFSASYTWKNQYYNHFCANHSDGQSRKRMIVEYLKSLKFTLLYYNDSCPSWSWYYPYRVAPLFSDIYFFLCSNENMDFNEKLSFSKGKPLTPFEQLMFILPPQSKENIPRVYHDLFIQYKQYYPDAFRIDALQGLKYIYSEAILPHWDCSLQFLYDVRKRHEFLSTEEKERNKISTKIYRYINK
jgi:5'-3' exonuclease